MKRYKYVLWLTCFIWGNANYAISYFLVQTNANNINQKIYFAENNNARIHYQYSIFNFQINSFINHIQYNSYSIQKQILVGIYLQKNWNILVGFQYMHQFQKEKKKKTNTYSAVLGTQHKLQNFLFQFFIDSKLDFQIQLHYYFPWKIPLEIQLQFESNLYFQSKNNWSGNIHVYQNWLQYFGTFLSYQYPKNQVSVGIWVGLHNQYRITTEFSFVNFNKKIYELRIQFVYFFRKKLPMYHPVYHTFPEKKSKQTADPSSASKYKKKKYQKANFQKQKNTNYRKRTVKKSIKVPSFSTLVKWGLSPKEAIQLVKNKNFCALKKSSQRIFLKKKWKFYCK